MTFYSGHMGIFAHQARKQSTLGTAHKSTISPPGVSRDLRHSIARLLPLAEREFDMRLRFHGLSNFASAAALRLTGILLTENRFWRARGAPRSISGPVRNRERSTTPEYLVGFF